MYLEKRDFLRTNRRESLTEELNWTSGYEKEGAGEGLRWSSV